MSSRHLALLDASLMAKVVLMGLLCGLISRLFAELTHGLQHTFQRYVPSAPARAALGGALVVENVFGVPGLGKRITEAILAKQYPALQSYVAIVAILYVVINFVIDILYSVLDPRIRNARAVA